MIQELMRVFKPLILLCLFIAALICLPAPGQAQVFLDSGYVSIQYYWCWSGWGAFLTFKGYVLETNYCPVPPVDQCVVITGYIGVMPPITGDCCGPLCGGYSYVGIYCLPGLSGWRPCDPLSYDIGCHDLIPYPDYPCYLGIETNGDTLWVDSTAGYSSGDFVRVVGYPDSCTPPDCPGYKAGNSAGRCLRVKTIESCIPDTCGDADSDGPVNVGDAVYIINYVFKGGPAPVVPCEGDANGDDAVNVADAVYLINYIFRSGPEPIQGCCQFEE